MSTLIKENELAIHRAVQDLKDSIFGMKQPFFSMGILKESENSTTLHQENFSSFIGELECIAKTIPEHEISLAIVLKNFWILSIKFLLVACPEEDWNFQSIKKLATTVAKKDSQTDSVFDILLRDAQSDLSIAYPNENDFWSLYNEFSSQIVNCDIDKFSQLNKHTLEKYIDKHSLNTLDSQDSTQRIVSHIERYSRQAEYILKKLCNVEGTWYE